MPRGRGMTVEYHFNFTCWGPVHIHGHGTRSRSSGQAGVRSRSPRQRPTDGSGGGTAATRNVDSGSDDNKRGVDVAEVSDEGGPEAVRDTSLSQEAVAGAGAAPGGPDGGGNNAGNEDPEPSPPMPPLGGVSQYSLNHGMPRSSFGYSEGRCE